MTNRTTRACIYVGVGFGLTMSSNTAVDCLWLLSRLWLGRWWWWWCCCRHSCCPGRSSRTECRTTATARGRRVPASGRRRWGRADGRRLQRRPAVDRRSHNICGIAAAAPGLGPPDSRHRHRPGQWYRHSPAPNPSNQKHRRSSSLALGSRGLGRACCYYCGCRDWHRSAPAWSDYMGKVNIICAWDRSMPSPWGRYRRGDPTVGTLGTRSQRRAATSAPGLHTAGSG